METIILIALVIGITVANYVLKSSIKKALNRKEEILNTKLYGIPFTQLIALANGLMILFSVILFFLSSDSGIATFLVPACVIYTISIIVILSGHRSQTVIYRLLRSMAITGNGVMAAVLALFGALGVAFSGRDVFEVLAILGAFGLTVAFNIFFLAKEQPRNA